MRVIRNISEGGADPARSCRFSKDGKLIAVGYDVGTVEVSEKKGGSGFSVVGLLSRRGFRFEVS